MTRNAIKLWLGACVLGSAMAAGCRNTPSSQVAHTRTPGYGEPLPAVATVPYYPSGLSSPYTVTDTSAVAKATSNERMKTETPAVPSLSELQQVSKADKMILPDPVTPPATPKPPRYETAGPAPMRPEPPAPRRSFVDLSAQPCFSHAEDYSWLSGQLQHFGRTWRLRYASVDEVDPHGGSVTLLEDARLETHKDGEYVRVQGRLADSEAKGTAPAYQVNTIQLLEKQPMASGQ